MGTEKRNYVRFKVLVDAEIQFGGRQLNGVVYDISLGGLQFVTEAEIQGGSTITIALPDLKEIGFRAKATVRWTKAIAQSDGMFKFGIEFEEPLEKIMLKAVLSRFRI